jgi:thioesterase domain-containing protein/NAD(P)-dependent dehydrogenase (short-subunit alcohol dehydrogenase family)
VLADDTGLSQLFVDRLRKRTGDRVVTVRRGRGFAAVGAMDYTVSPASAADYELVARDLRRLGISPGRIVHLWSLAARPNRTSRRMLLEYGENIACDYYSLVFLVRALGGEIDEGRVDVLSSGMHAAPGDTNLNPEKAVVAGVRRVLAREYPQLAFGSVDVKLGVTKAEHGPLVARLVQELDAGALDADVALRGRDRWIRRFDAVALPEGSAAAWVRPGGVYLVTGGLGGLGMAVAEHLARSANAKIVLVGRSALPGDERAGALRALGADVMVCAADVTDAAAMRGVVAETHARFGRICGVFHAAGQLHDQLVALRATRAESAVLDTKVRGALVLDMVTQSDEPDLFVLFSSVSSVLGLPGQADYAAANAFLDAFAFARAAAHPRGHTLSVDWNAWREVGMLASAAGSGARASGEHPLLGAVVEDAAGTTLFKSVLRPEGCWPLSEHVVRGSAAVLPGTAMLELARAAYAHGRAKRDDLRAIEIRDAVFLAPFSVATGGERLLHVRVDRSAGTFVAFGESEHEVFARGKVASVEAPPSAVADLAVVRERCRREGALECGALVQHFMDFGPRWACIRSIRLGDGEAVLDLALPTGVSSDLEVYRLHPALLDMATGGAQALVPGFDPQGDFYVPFSYGRLILRSSLPARMTSHVRWREGSGRDSPVFDAALYDEQGHEIARVEGFMMRRAAHRADAGAAGSPGESTFGRAGEDPRGRALRLGMTPGEGIQALDRILSWPASPQVVACTVDLDTWLAQLARESRAVRGAPATGEGGALFARPSLSATFAEPRDEVERELAAIWRDLLGVSEVGVHDDFFELGGQSLVAVRMFHRIGKKFGVDLQLASLFEAPTIAHVASLLRSRMDIAESPQEASPPVTTSPHGALVTIQPGGAWPPFFCVHGAGGNVLCFRELARAMNEAQPFYGLQARGVDGISPPHETVEEMADAYISEVRSLQPEGPYFLGGYSGGGIVAFEMARRLTASGCEVGLLAFIDTFHPQMALRPVTIRSRAERLRDERLAYIGEALARSASGWKRSRGLRSIEEHRARGAPIPFALRDLYMTRAFERAAARYRPASWSGRAILFRASRVAYIYRDGGPSYGWETHLTGGLDIIPVSGDHSTILLGTNADFVARELAKTMARVRAAPLTQPAPGVVASGA